MKEHFQVPGLVLFVPGRLLTKHNMPTMLNMLTKLNFIKLTNTKHAQKQPEWSTMHLWNKKHIRAYPSRGRSDELT